MNALRYKTLTAKELADLVGMTSRRITQVAIQLADEGLAELKTSGWIFDPEAVDWIKSRPETRGRKPKKSKSSRKKK